MRQRPRGENQQQPLLHSQQLLGMLIVLQLQGLRLGLGQTLIMSPRPQRALLLLLYILFHKGAAASLISCSHCGPAAWHAERPCHRSFRDPGPGPAGLAQRNLIGPARGDSSPAGPW